MGRAPLHELAAPSPAATWRPSAPVASSPARGPPGRRGGPTAAAAPPLPAVRSRSAAAGARAAPSDQLRGAGSVGTRNLMVH
eukprot:2616738-Pyramimonas_sp.AAC.1